MPIVALKDVSKSFGPEVVLSGLSQHFYPGQKAGLIGPNGCGKTTLLRLILGECHPDSGDIVRRKGMRIGYLPQEARFAGDLTVLEEAEKSLYSLLELERRLEDLGVSLAELRGREREAAMREYERVQHQFEVGGGYQCRARMKSILASLGLGQEFYQVSVSALSGGQLSRLGLAKVLIQGADLLLLDEPTNHLDLQAVSWLQRFLSAFDGAVILISHDRYLLDHVAEKIVEMRGGQTTTWNGNYSQYVKQRAEVDLHEQRRYEKRAEMVRRTKDFIARNKDQEGMRGTARGRKKRLERLLKENPDYLEKQAARQEIDLAFGRRQSRTELILRAENLSMAFDAVQLFANVTFDVLAGERLGITGPNGTGKSTLLKLAMGSLQPTEGSIRMADTVEVGYLDQQGASLDAESTVLSEARGANPALSAERVRTVLGALLFTGDDVFKAVGALSGGQQNRLMLAKLVLSAPDVLVLDEPTNHLDIASREALEQALSGYEGTLIFVSHDRYFLDRVADRLLVLGNNSVGERAVGCYEFVGGPDHVYTKYVDRLEQRRARDRAEASKRTQQEAVTATKVSTTPTHLRPFNKYSVEEIEDMILAAEARVGELQERFGDESLYQDPAKLKKLQEQLKSKMAEVELLYEAYEWRS